MNRRTFSGGIKKPAEPTQDDVRAFIKCVRDAPPKYFSDYKDPTSADYGTCYTSYYNVMDWLRYKFDV